MQKNNSTCRKIINFVHAHFAAAVNEVMAMELKRGRVDSRSVFDALSIDEGLMLRNYL